MRATRVPQDSGLVCMRVCISHPPCLSSPFIEIMWGLLLHRCKEVRKHQKEVRSNKTSALCGIHKQLSAHPSKNSTTEASQEDLVKQQQQMKLLSLDDWLSPREWHDLQEAKQHLESVTVCAAPFSIGPQRSRGFIRAVGQNQDSTHQPKTNEQWCLAIRLINTEFFFFSSSAWVPWFK